MLNLLVCLLNVDCTLMLVAVTVVLSSAFLLVLAASDRSAAQRLSDVWMVSAGLQATGVLAETSIPSLRFHFQWCNGN